MRLVKVPPLPKNYIQYYRCRTMEELQKIHVRWAYGRDAGRLLNYGTHPDNLEYTIFIVGTSELLDKSDFGEFELQPLFTGKLLNDHRISMLLHHWDNSGFVDPPSIGLSNSMKNQLSIDDGRHRTKLAWYLGIKELPIAIHNSQIEQVNQIIFLNQI